MVYFLPFSKSEINKLLLKELEFWRKRVSCFSSDIHTKWFSQAKEQHNIDIIWDRKALDCLANGYDINYGARSLKHEVILPSSMSEKPCFFFHRLNDP